MRAHVTIARIAAVVWVYLVVTAILQTAKGQFMTFEAGAALWGATEALRTFFEWWTGEVDHG